MNDILEVNEISKSYKKFTLDKISFTLERGSITGFIGINGSGKTTTIKSILGLCIIDNGNIKFLNKDIYSNEKYFKNHIGVVLDEGYFYDNLTLMEMKSIVAPAYKNWIDSTFMQYLDRFNLNPRQQISALSKGMRMKYSLALALSHDADLLIMDEPTSGLDPYIREELMVILQEFIKNKDKAVFFSTHITSDLDKIADNIIMINNGHIILNESKTSLLQRHKIIEGNNINLLNEDMRSLFLMINETSNGFKGITNRTDQFINVKDFNFVRPTIEEIMLSYIKEEEE